MQRAVRLEAEAKRMKITITAPPAVVYRSRRKCGHLHIASLSRGVGPFNKDVTSYAHQRYQKLVQKP